MRQRTGVVVASVLAAFGLGFVGPTHLGQPEAFAQSPAAFVPVPCEPRDWSAPETPFTSAQGTNTRALTGKYSGGLYRIEIPEKWNGELVLWAHGYVATTGAGGTTLRVGNPPVRAHFIERGFAWAASSYQCNGYVAGQGLLDTVALLDEFTKVNGGKAPSRTYFFGGSMGGYAALLAMHEMPAAFDGALAICPAGPDLLDFFGQAATAAAKATGLKPTAASLQDDLKTLATALGTPPAYTAAGRDAANQQIVASGGPRPFAEDGLNARNQFFSNITLGAPALVPAAPQPAPSYREQLPFGGRISRPVLTMHTTGDLFVPIFVERTLNKAVTAANRKQYLVQRIYRAAGHCTFSDEEIRTAFEDLVIWVRNGTMPKGDDVMGDLSDAGRQFTNPIRPGDPGGLIVK